MNDQPLHLLIVDDEEAHVEAVRRAFDAAGTNADIHVAGTLREYREQVAAHPPDIALVDLNLPDGRATEILTLPPENAPFPVLVITAFGNQQTVVEVMKAGALDYVVKSPEAFATMPRTVESTLREWNLLQSHKRMQLTLQMTQRCMDRASDAVFWIAPDARLLYVNEAACRNLGYSRDELLAMSVPDIDPNYQADAWPAHWTELRRSGSMIFESRHRAKDGRVYPTEVSANYLNFNGLEINFAFVRDINERKCVEQALCESELKHRTLFEMANDAILLMRQGRFVDCNAQAQILFGCSREQIVGASPQTFSPPTQPDGRRSEEKALEKIHKALTEGPQFFEWEHCRPEGTRFTVELSLNRLEWGGEVLLQAIVRDITERKRVEKALRETQDLLNDVGRIARIGGWKMDLSTRKATWTLATYDIVEIAPGQPIPGPDDHEDYYLPEYRPLVAEAIRALIENDKPMEFEAQARTAKGNIKWCRAIGRAIREGGKAVEIYGTLQDITERKRAEEALERERNLLRTLIDNIPDAIYVRDTANRFVLANETVARRMGVASPADLIGKTDADFYPPEQAAHFASADRKVLAGRTLVNFEEDVVHLDGKRRFILGTKVPLKDAQGAVTALVGIGRDITERKRTEEQIRKTNRSLRMISDCNQELVRATNETDLLQGICRIAVEHGGYRMVWVGFAGQDEAKSVRPVAQFGFEEGYLDTVNITWADVERGRGPTGTAIRTGQPVIARNISTDPTFGPWREAAVERGYASSLALPLIAGERAFGALILNAPMPDAFDAEEVALLTELANDLAYGIGALRHRAERERAEAEVTRTAREWQTTFDATNDAVWLLDKEQRVMRSNRTAERIFQRPCAELIGKHCWEIVHGTASPIPECPIQRVKKSLRRESSELQISQRWFEVTCDPILDAAGQYAGAVHIVSDVTERKRAEQALQRQSEELRVRNEELERFNNASVGRELRMIELKQEINVLCQQAGLPRRYPLNFTNESEKTDGNMPPITPEQP
ncbi:MAG: PAS domain S-box protein [Verrucomicrobiia bacterium]